VSTNVGSSTLTNVEWTIGKLRRIAPSSILDAGCGFGKVAFLAREYLEVWNHRYVPEDWKIHITGIDAHGDTWNPCHAYLYDEMVQADVRLYRPSRSFDVVVANDVVEHMPKDDGERMIGMFLEWAPQVLVGIPLGPGWLHGGVDGNPWEAHLAEWNEADFDFLNVVDRRIGHTEDGPSYAYGQFHLTR